jgi:hypothetical protein
MAGHLNASNALSLPAVSLSNPSKGRRAILPTEHLGYGLASHHSEEIA